jgi:hypothetical protein
VKSDPEVIAKIGEIAKRNTTSFANLEFDFDQKIDWRSGDFGDSGSCFWGDNSDAKRLIRDNGFAFRAWRREGSGIARCWIAADFPDENDLVAFNFYGWSKEQMRKALMNWLSQTLECKVHVADIYLRNNGSKEGLLYMNGDGVVLSPTNKVERSYDLRWSRKKSAEEKLAEERSELITRIRSYSRIINNSQTFALLKKAESEVRAIQKQNEGKPVYNDVVNLVFNEFFNRLERVRQDKRTRRDRKKAQREKAAATVSRIE